MSNNKGLSSAECLKSFSADSLSWAHVGHWVLNQLHQGKMCCPHCQCEIADEKRIDRWNQCERIECKSCGRFFTSLTGTVLQSSQLDPREVYLLAVLSELQVPVAKIAELVDVHKDTVKNWQKKLQPAESVA